jgi:hypothetical protein
LVKFGSFTVADVEAESSHIKSKGKLTHLGKNLWMVLVLYLCLQVIRQMKLTNLMNFMKNLKSQLVLILGLAKRWRELNKMK